MTAKRLLPLVFLTVVVFAGLLSYGDFKDIGRQLSRFPLTHLFAALGLALANYGLRYLRWSYYLGYLKIPLPFGVSFFVFISGLAMSVTPAKAGELLKCYLVRDRAGIPVAMSAPVVVMERLTDVISLVLLVLLGLALLPVPVLAVVAVVLLLSGGALLVILTRRSDGLVDLPFLRHWKDSLLASYAGMRRLSMPQPMAVAVVLGVGAWLSEGLALWVVLDGLDAHISLSSALPIYAAATLVGAVSALPGGLIGTEGSMVALLQQSGVARGAASAGTLVVRLATLWFAVALGLLALFCLNRFFPVVEGSGERGQQPMQARS